MTDLDGLREELERERELRQGAETQAAHFLAGRIQAEQRAAELERNLAFAEKNGQLSFEKAQEYLFKLKAFEARKADNRYLNLRAALVRLLDEETGES